MRVMFAVSLALFFAFPAQTEARETETWEGVGWYRLVQVDYHGGKTSEARRIIEEQCTPTSSEAGPPAPDMLLRHETGEWDLTTIWNLKEGTAPGEWRGSPDNVRSWRTFMERDGSEEAAEKIQDGWSTLVAGSTSSIGRAM